MIYGLEDTILLTRIAARKSIELAGIPHDGGTVASMKSMMLVDDLNRIQLLWTWRPTTCRTSKGGWTS